MNKPYAAAEGLSYAPIGRFNNACNYPLMRGKNEVVFRCIAPPKLPKLQAELIAPRGAIRISEGE